MQGVEILKLLATRTYCGLGYIIIPPDVERLDYIQTCFSTETVSFYPETGGTSYNDVPVSRSALQEIEFPDIGHRFGSQVIYLLHPTHRLPIIIGVLDKLNESITLGWKEFKFSKILENNEVTVLGDAKEGNLFISVVSEDPVGGKLLIDIVKEDQQGLLQVQVQGSISFLSSTFRIQNESTTIDSQEILLNAPQQVFNNEVTIINAESKIEVRTDLLEITNNTTQILSESKISLGLDPYEPAVLGNTLVSLMEELIDAVLQLTVPTGTGPSGTPINASAFSSVKDKLEQILSQKVELE